ncbi:MAG: hypothetical protein ACREXS_00155 [Gammaproteobacteria bacterium]
MAEGKEFLSKLIDSPPGLLIILGAALLALGLAGGVTYSQWFPIPEIGARIGAGVAGIVVFALGVSRAKTHVFLPKAKKYGIKIDYPTDGDVVDIVDVSGSLSKPLPEGFTPESTRVQIATSRLRTRECSRAANGQPRDAISAAGVARSDQSVSTSSARMVRR